MVKSMRLNVEVVKKRNQVMYIGRPEPVGYILVRVLDKLGKQIKERKSK